MDDRLSALSQRQRECLRLVAQGLEAKEIGRTLGISDLTVKNHLSAARAILGVARSIEAARLLAATEAAATRIDPPHRARADDGAGTSRTGTPPGIADRSYLDVEEPGQSEVPAAFSGIRDGSGIAPPRAPAEWSSLPATRRGLRNDLGIGARLAIVVLLTVLLIAAVGFFVEASRGLRF